MPLYKTVALVLRRIPLGEKDKILTLFSRDLGKLRAVAKGARKPTSKLSGASEPLLLLRASLAEGSSLDVLSEAEVREAFPKLKSDLRSKVDDRFDKQLIHTVRGVGYVLEDRQ